MNLGIVLLVTSYLSALSLVIYFGFVNKRLAKVHKKKTYLCDNLPHGVVVLMISDKIFYESTKCIPPWAPMHIPWGTYQMPGSNDIFRDLEGPDSYSTTFYLMLIPGQVYYLTRNEEVSMYGPSRVVLNLKDAKDGDVYCLHIHRDTYTVTNLLRTPI